MSWLPKDYKVPQGSSQFMKLEKGQNKLRILGQPIIGYEWWEESTEGKKPFRVKTFEEAVRNGREPIKHFWAFAVWNYSNESCQVLSITQKTIMKALEALSIDEDWGNPEKFDIVITRTGDGMETDYTVQPKPAKEIDHNILEAYKESKIDLEALFSGNYPMETQKDENEPSSKLETSEDTLAEDVADDIPFN